MFLDWNMMHSALSVSKCGFTRYLSPTLVLLRFQVHSPIVPTVWDREENTSWTLESTRIKHLLISVTSQWPSRLPYISLLQVYCFRDMVEHSRWHRPSSSKVNNYYFVVCVFPTLDCNGKENSYTVYRYLSLICFLDGSCFIWCLVHRFNIRFQEFGVFELSHRSQDCTTPLNWPLLS